MKIRIKIVVLCILIGVYCCGCRNGEVKLPQAIDIILNRNGIYSAEIAKLDDYSKYKLNYDGIKAYEIEASDEEVKSYIDMQLESYAKLRQINSRDIVENGDVVIVSYLVSLNGKVVNEVTQDILMVGSGNYDQQFESILVGKQVGIPLVEKLLSPTGEWMTFSIIIESINYFETVQLTDEFVNENMEVDTVEEYYAKCEKFLYNEKLYVEREKIKKQLLEEIIDNSEFLLNVNEVAQFSLQYVMAEEQFATVYGMDLEEYMESILEENREEFFEHCYECGEYELKKYMLIGAIFTDLGYSIEMDDVEKMCEQLGYEYSYVKEKEYEYALVEYKIMEEMVLDYLSK